MAEKIESLVTDIDTDTGNVVEGNLNNVARFEQLGKDYAERMEQLDEIGKDPGIPIELESKAIENAGIEAQQLYDEEWVRLEVEMAEHLRKAGISEALRAGESIGLPLEDLGLLNAVPNTNSFHELDSLAVKWTSFEPNSEENFVFRPSIQIVESIRSSRIENEPMVSYAVSFITSPEKPGPKREDINATEFTLKGSYMDLSSNEGSSNREYRMTEGKLHFQTYNPETTDPVFRYYNAVEVTYDSKGEVVLFTVRNPEGNESAYGKSKVVSSLDENFLSELSEANKILEDKGFEGGIPLSIELKDSLVSVAEGHMSGQLTPEVVEKSPMELPLIHFSKKSGKLNWEHLKKRFGYEALHALNEEIKIVESGAEMWRGEEEARVSERKMLMQALAYFSDEERNMETLTAVLSYLSWSFNRETDGEKDIANTPAREQSLSPIQRDLVIAFDILKRYRNDFYHL